ALEVINQHPELHSEKSAVLELAYEEYCLRASAGETVDSGDFCQRFPAYRTSLARLLEVHSYFADHPNLADASEIQWPALGAEIAGFLLEEELGRGGFARVYLSRETSLGH